MSKAVAEEKEFENNRPKPNIITIFTLYLKLLWYTLGMSFWTW